MDANLSSSKGDALGSTVIRQTADRPAPGADHWSRELARAADPFDGAVVLIVDDNDANVLLLERILAGAGVRDVHGVLDSRLAVARCLELDPDLVLLDLHMPHLDGFDILEALGAALPRDLFPPVIVLTGDSSTPIRERALGAGAKDFLTKPFDRVEVLQRARNLLQTWALYQGIRRDHLRLQAEFAVHVDAQRQLELDRERARERVRAVLEGEALTMVFQPIADLDTGRTVGVESLARFATEPLRPPDVWFDEAAEVGLGRDLELAAIRGALDQLAQLPPGMLLSLNASPATAMEPELLELLAAPVAPRVVLELTEHYRVPDYPALLSSLDALRGHGVRIAVDDAGAGYAGLQQILDLHPDLIKLDLMLTRGVDADPVRGALAAALVTFAQKTGAVLIAEGIETPAELDTLRQLGVPWGQGYLLGRPGPLPTVEIIEAISAARRSGS